MEAADTIGFIEEFALAEDREAVLRKLIPGTEDYYYFHALHHTNEAEWEKLASVMEPWVKRYGENARVWEIRNREALLRYGENPRQTIDYLRRRLGLRFDHRQQPLNAKPDLEVRLDQNRISWNAYLDRAFRHSRQLNHVEDSGLDRIVREQVQLDETRRRDLLSRLVYPDYENLPGLIAADLRTRESRGFGEFAIHRNLLPDQLEELARLVPDLARNQQFVYTKIAKLYPSPDTDWHRDSGAREAYLTAVWDYVKTLDASFNSLKAHSLFQLLKHHRSRGDYPRDLWMTYLKLPRSAGYIEPRLLRTPEGRSHQADLGADFREVTLCPPVGSDEELVREFLLREFRDGPGTEEFEPFIREDYLKPIFAEAKLTGGVGDAERWFSLLSPSEVKRLKDRVDIEFAPSSREQYLPGDDVVLEVDVKNVGDLTVKVYEINALNYYLDEGREVNTDLNLDGLIANEEFKHRFDEAPIRRVRRTFPLESLQGKRGIWIVELIGNGVSSRALIRKGTLQYLAQHTAAGTRLRILDEANHPVEDPAVWFGGRKVLPDEKGRIFLPFSESGNTRVILSDGNVAALDEVELPREEYLLDAGFHVDRESLLPGAKAGLAVRPNLRLAGERVSLELLDEVKLVVRSTDLDGIETVQEVPGFALAEGKESIHEFRVPLRLQNLTVSLEGKVSRVSAGGEKVTVSDAASFPVNGIDQTGQVGDLHLSRIGEEFVLEVFGKSGEPLADRALSLSLDHEDFNLPVQASLKSDENGRIFLGPLAEIEKIEANGDGFLPRSWALAGNVATTPDTIHVSEGAVVEIPLDREGNLTRSDLAVMERRGNTFVGDHFGKVTLEKGILRIGDLSGGDYEVGLRESGKRVRVRVTKAERAELGFALSQYRHLEVGNARPVQVGEIVPGEEEIEIRLVNAGVGCRVHVFATRFLPEFPMVANLGDLSGESLSWIGRGGFESRYLSGRDIGEEYRYILERRAAKKFPGNLAHRPGLILNPWALRDTDTTIDDARKGEAYKRSRETSRAKREEADRRSARTTSLGEPPHSRNLDFLASGAPVSWNLEPDENGVITVKRELLGDRQHLHVVALDEGGAAYRQLSLEEGEGTRFRDLRLRSPLDPERHFTQRRRVTLLRDGNILHVPDLRSSELETYDTLNGIYSVMSGIANRTNPGAAATFGEFSFVLEWPNLAEERKRELYSKYACHELSFFLSRRDPEFFGAVIQPYLANKRDKTFLDHYLLGNDLSGYLDPWRYGRLNIVERILLGRRLGDDGAEGTRRAVREWWDLLPKNPEETDLLYQSALRGRTMGGGFGGGGRFNFSVDDLAVAEPMMAPAPAEAPADSFGMSGALRGGARSMAMPRPVAAAAPEAEPEAVADEEEGAAMKVMEDAVESKYEARIAGVELQQLREEALGRALYRKLESTRELAENNYYHLPIEQQVADLITVNDYWKDFAAWNGEGGFYSRHFTKATGNFAEMMLGLAVLDLPFEAKEHEVEIGDGSFTMTARSPVIIFHEEIEERGAADERPDILVSQNFFRAEDRYQTIEGERVDKFVTGEFLTGVRYGCQVVVTNPNSSSQKLDLLLQVPQGAVPVERADYTKTYPIRLNPFSTETVEMHFYFPENSGEGMFAHYPVHVAKNERPVAWARPFAFKVVDQLTELDTASWEYLSQYGTGEEVLNYLNTNNVYRIDLNRIAWRMREDVDFFRSVIELLRGRYAYADLLWSYGLFHNDLPVAREYLTQQEAFLHQCGGRLDCELVSIEPVERHWYQHLEYSPLVNARAHRLGRDRKILNDRLHSQYHDYMNLLSYGSGLSSRDRLGVAYYLFLQDRVGEALAWLEKVQPEEVETELQYDYLQAYAALYREEPAVAGEIAERHREHPVDKWRKRFVELGDQVREIRGERNDMTEREDREERQDALAATDPVIDLRTEGTTVSVTHRNVGAITFNYYEMDLEYLFSSQPFVSGESGQFSYIRPNFSEEKAVAGGGDVLEFEIPERFSGRNVLVEAVAAGQKRSSPVFANSLDVQLSENYGRVQVRDRANGAPLAKTYVKVYARFGDGQVKFFKDGYTDLRGKFDYVSLNTDEIGRVREFSVLVMSEQHGALVREAKPPRM